MFAAGQRARSFVKAAEKKEMAWLKSGYAPICGYWNAKMLINYWILWGISIFDKPIHEAKSLCLIVGKVTNKFVIEISLTFLAFSAFESAF